MKNKIVSLILVLIFPSITNAYLEGSYTDTITNIQDVSFHGSTTNELMGVELAKGDINGDQIDDLIVSSPYSSSKGLIWNGKVTIYYGDDNFNETPKTTTIIGKDQHGLLGSAIIAADINADGFDDIVIGAPHTGSGKNKPAGKTYIVWGDEYLKQEINLHNEQKKLEIISHNSGDKFGLVLESGDINMDGISDLIISSPLYKSLEGNGQGRVYGLYGSKIRLNNIPIMETNREEHFDFMIKGPESRSSFGSSLLLKGNHLIVGSYLHSTEPEVENGSIFIYDTTKVSSSTEHDTYDYKIIGEATLDWLGFSLANFTGDRFLVGAYGYKQGHKQGKVYEINLDELEKGHTYIENISSKKIIGQSAVNLIGSEILVTDFNNDSKKDLILNSPLISNKNSNFKGKTSIYYSYEEFLADAYIEVEKHLPDVLIETEASNDWFSASNLSLDINNDGLFDLVISSPYSDKEELINNGEIHIIFGESNAIGEFKPKPEEDIPTDTISRGEFLKIFFDTTNLEETKSTYLKNCKNEIEYCLFTFDIISEFEMSFDPLQLYSDVPPEHPYADYINMATMIGFVNGYISEEGNPFKPDKPIKKIQALKIILSGLDLVKWQFEKDPNFIPEVLFDDINEQAKETWWYLKYANFAYKNGIIDGDNLNANKYITATEAAELIQKTLNILE